MTNPPTPPGPNFQTLLVLSPCVPYTACPHPFFLFLADTLEFLLTLPVFPILLVPPTILLSTEVHLSYPLSYLFR